MKKLLIILLLITLSPVAMASEPVTFSVDKILEVIDEDFSHGQTEDGYWCFSENCNIVYGSDGSLIGDYENRKTIGSSLWYVRKAIDSKRLATQRYWYRVEAIKRLK